MTTSCPPKNNAVHASTRNKPSSLDSIVLDALASEIASTAAEHDASAEFPFRNFERLADAGQLALTVGTKHGGFGGDLRDTCRLVQAIGGAEASTGLVLAMTLVMHHLLSHDDAPIYPRVAAAAIEGGGIINALRAEPDLGSVSRGGLPGTVARRLPDGSWRLDGRKSYATGSPIVQWWLVFARTDEDEPRVGRWLVPAQTEGMRVMPSWNHAGMRATGSHEILIENVVLPADAVLTLNRISDQAIRERAAVLETWNGLVLASLYEGVARSARAWLQHFLLHRKPSNLGAALATVPRLQAVVGEIDALLFVNRTVLDEGIRNAVLAEADGRANPQEAMLVKHIVTNNVVKSLELALSITGNHGLDRANPLERHYRDALCGRVHAPQSDMVLLNAGKAALGV